MYPYSTRHILEVITWIQKVTVTLELVTRLLGSEISHRGNRSERRHRKVHVYIQPQQSATVRYLSLALSLLTVHWFLDANIVLAARTHCFTFSWMLSHSLSWVLLQPLVHTDLFIPARLVLSRGPPQNVSPRCSPGFSLSLASVICLWIKCALLWGNKNHWAHIISVSSSILGKIS